MAVTILTEIAGQVASATFSYSYLFEPLRIQVTESTSTATKIYVDLELIELGSNTIVNTLIKYADFDLSQNLKISFDLMEIAKQQRDANVYKNANVDDLISSLGIWSILGKYKLNFKIYSDVNATPVLVKKIPIIGGREFSQFTQAVSSNTPINEFEYYGLNVTDYEERWGDVWMPRVSLVSPILANANPTVTKIFGGGPAPCGNSFLIWKSRFGGWMWWGFEMKRKDINHAYVGSLEVGMFESNAESGGDAYIPVDYTGINTNYSLTLKSLALSKLEIQAVSGIKAAAVVYYLEPGSENLELMRLQSADTPWTNLSNGGDFTVSLRNISKTRQTTI